MQLNEIFIRLEPDNSFEEFLESSEITESAKMAWARKGNKIVKKYRCTAGKRKGRIVSKPAQCSAPIDIKKRLTLKKTKAKFGAKMARKSKKTKRTNPASKRLKGLNR